MALQNNVKNILDLKLLLVRDHLQISLQVLHEFKGINCYLTMAFSPWPSLRKTFTARSMIPVRIIWCPPSKEDGEINFWLQGVRDIILE